MPNLATQLQDISTIRAILLQQLGSSITNEVKTAYLAILDDIKSKILKHEELDVVRTKQIIKEIRAIIFPKLNLEDQLKTFAIDERDWLLSSTNKAIGANVFAAVPPESLIVAIGNAPVIEGALLKDWISGLNDKTKFDFERSINLAMLNGESTQESVLRLIKVMDISMVHAETLVRTAISDVSNRVREEVYSSNNDVVKGREFSAIMDNRTSKFICAPRDGAQWDNNGKGLNEKGRFFKFQLPPLHFRCRSTTPVILKSWDEIDPSLGWKTEIPELTKASMDGEISDKITFEQWLKSKDDEFITEYLGKGRSELFIAGKINMTELLTRNGKALTLAQLRAKYA